MDGDTPARIAAVRRLRRRRRLLRHAAATLVVNGVFVAVWVLTKLEPVPAGRAAEGFWPGWIMLLTGLPLVLHALLVLGMGPVSESAIRRQLDPDESRPPPARTGRAVATVLFTDIVGSTERASQIGDRRWRELLDLHDEVARRLVDQFEGRLIKTTGDGILATFDAPGRGIRCAVGLRSELRAIGIDLRAGLHTGEVEFRGRDVGGIAVHIAARIMAAANAGQILVSTTVRDIVRGSDIALEDRALHPLKGTGGDWRLFEVTRA